LKDCDDEQTVNTSNKRGLSFLILNEEKYDSSSEKDGDRIGDGTSSYSHMNTLT